MNNKNLISINQHIFLHTGTKTNTNMNISQAFHSLHKRLHAHREHHILTFSLESMQTNAIFLSHFSPSNKLPQLTRTNFEIKSEYTTRFIRTE